MEGLRKWFSNWSRQTWVKRIWTLAVCTLILLIEGRAHLERHFVDKVRVIAAKRDLAPGLKITLHDLTVTLVKKTEGQHKKYFEENRLHHVVGKEVTLPLSIGEPVTENHLDNPRDPWFSRRIPKGYRAFLLRMNQIMPIEAGDRVDVVGMSKGSSEGQEVFLENRQVLGVKSGEDYSEVLLAVFPLEVPRLQAAYKEGEIKLLLRNPKDHENPSSKKRQKIGPRPRAKIEVWEGK